MSEQGGRRERGIGIDLDGLLGTIYKPILPLTRRIRIRREGDRRHDPDDILLPEGYVAEVVATGLNAPVHCCFDDRGFCYVSECGHKIDSKPRIVRIDVRTGQQETFFELPDDRWEPTGAFTGACWVDGSMYFTNTDTLSRVTPEGGVEDVVAGLPWGDHHTNYPVLGPDGKIYWGQGSATNTGIVGADNAAYEWLPNFPRNHDVPARDVVLAGRNYEHRDVLGSVLHKVRTGAFVPFGTETRPGEVIEGQGRPTGAIMRCNPDGSELEVVAWGLRNPYGVAFHPNGRLFATEHGIDERSSRYIVGDPDDFYEIVAGRWYGWPDFASGVRLDDPHWGRGGKGREPVLAEHPDSAPPAPFVTFEPHAGSNGVAFSRSAAFGFEGDAFVALFGDVAPVTVPGALRPAGFKVVRVDMRRRDVVDFAVNRISGPASKLPHAGFERPSHCAFGPDGALYVVDWGEIKIAPEVGGLRMKKGTGTLWRIRRTAGPAGDRPPRARQVPLYLLLAIGILGAGAGTVAVLIGVIRRLRRGRTRAEG